MATAAVTNSFAAGTLIESVEVNTNFQDLVTFLNNSTVHTDGSKTFTGIPSVSGGAAVDPISDNQLTRKAYVDKQKVLARQRFTTNGAALSGTVNSDFVLTPTMDNTRLYKACLHTNWVTSASVTYIIQLTEDANVIGEFDITDGNRDIVDGTLYFEPTSGAHTYRIRVFEVVGGGTVTFVGTATAPRHFWIEDTGIR